MELQWEEKMKRITEITKRDILDLFRNGLEINEFFDTKTVIYHYFGRIAFCGAQRTPMRFRADAVRSITDALNRLL